MKKLSLLLALCLVFGLLAGCGGEVKETEPSTEPSQTTQATEPSETTEDTTPPETTEPPPTEPPYPVIIGYELDMLEEFDASISEDDRLLYVSPYAPEDESHVLIQITPRDESVLTLDEEGFKALEEEERDFRNLTLESTTVDGLDALFVDYTIKLDGVYTHYYEYHVVGDRNYMFRFADSTKNNDWLEAYAACAETIDLILGEETIELDYSHLEQYQLDCGVKLYAFGGMDKQDAPGFTACIGNQRALILVMQDNKADNALENLSLEEYADLVAKANELDPFTQDNYGNLHIGFYSNDELGVRYYNNLTVKESDDSFWVFQMTCAADDQATYDREFALWATSISFE